MSHYKQHSPESTPFTMWQDLCVAAGHACRLAALVVQGSSTAAAMAEYGPVYSTFGERKRGAVYGWKVRKVVGLLKHYFYTVCFFDFSEFQWSTKNIGKHAMNLQMMHDVWWIFASMEPRCIFKKWCILWFMAYTNDLYVFKTPSGEGLQGAHSKCHQLFAKLFCNSSIVYEIVLTIV